jgi:2-dehydro-3-deoxy-phosphogluconate/2-dehydro-3-deoxy-6-phosphogalactonate aldolase
MSSKKHAIVPTVTPFTGNEVDVEKLKHHAESLYQEGVDFVFLAGTTGLGPSLRMEERERMAQALSQYKEKLILQVGSLDLEASARLAEFGRDLGVHAIAAYPPYYFQRIPDDWMVKYFLKLSKIHPLIVYNYPGATGYDISSSIIKEAIRQGGEIIGIKDTIPDLGHMLSFKWDIGEDFLVYSGPDTVIVSAIRSGMDGSVAGSGNYAPELLVQIVSDGALSESLAAQKTIASLAMLSRKYGQWSANYSLTKLIRGYDVGAPRTPISPLTSEQEEKLSQEIRTVFLREKHSPN